MLLSELTGYAEARHAYSREAQWRLFDGDHSQMNIAHECIDRHAKDSQRVAVRIARADGGSESMTFRELSAWSSRFAHWLNAQGIQAGDRIAFMLEPSPAFYVALFGSMKAGAISVPLFTLFGPDGLRLRLDDCTPALLLVEAAKLEMAKTVARCPVVLADAQLFERIAPFPDTFEPKSRAEDLAAFQYTSGTTRELPTAVRHTHRSIVTLVLAALYGTGVRPGDEFFCPSSPAWGHGLWHGTLAPLSLGVTTGTLSGKFSALRLLEALQEFRVSTLSAAATHYRMIKATGEAERFTFCVRKLSYTGEPIDPATLEYTQALFGVPVCSMYGTTEVGVILVNYPGAPDFTVKPGSLGKPIPGQVVQVQDATGAPCPASQIGELKLKRRDEWISTKDLGYTDADGYFFHAGRADDVIISAGWTMSAVEIENVLLKHPDVREAAAIGVPDEARGNVVKAFIVSPRTDHEVLRTELQQFTKERLSLHEYPRVVAFVDELPKTPAGKVNRRILREREAASRADSQGHPA